jgi:hypothetical protein
MNSEWALLLSMMKEMRQHRAEYPLPASAAVVAPAPASRLSNGDRAMIESAIRRAMECATGKLIAPAGRQLLALPEFRAECTTADPGR